MAFQADKQLPRQALGTFLVVSEGGERGIRTTDGWGFAGL